ncbi:hypothetical protein [Mesorhizobium neociceri]|uniref:Immunogenic protein (Bcsp31-1) n=1 Tax=Mesorhizobium neociceri TaxID=1307853 RepID=A0A838B808_9HYPH|nr:hypothetical protein [Mesorhizobium neociceri]MBA1142262.1 hypothetical protein [Mesorhizobium neociceri]
MKRLLILFAVGLALAACDNNIQPTKAPVVDQVPQPTPKSPTGGDQLPPAQ